MEEQVKQTEPVLSDQKNSGRSFGNFFANNFLAFSILATGVLIASSILYSNAKLKVGTAQIIPDSGEPAPGAVQVPVSVDDDPSMGNKNAKVTIVEFSDYQCPFCRIFWKEALPQILKEYVNTGKARLVYRDYPLSFHPMAIPSAQAAECAEEQGKYWEMHDKIFGEQEKLGQGTVTFTVQDLKRWAGEISLDKTKFNQCLDSNKYKAEVDKDFSDGTAAGVSGTPTLFINGRRVVGAQPFSVFKAIIDEELSK